ncbi:MAG TPA: hypothetical protein VJ841_04165 [Candidatus Saccharimonadales bacterium]|nr:hypothetical protein [Candidatus Saccharimonadales bacterium]
MRDQVAWLSPTRGVTRRFLLFFTALIVSVFGVIFTLTPTANAADGTWKDGTITYEGNTYTRYGNGIPNQTADIPKGAQVYTYSSSSDKSATPPKVNIIWFASGEDPAKAKTAHYGYYSQTGDATFSDPSKQATVTFSGDAASTDEAGKEGETTSCIVDGIGWIVCPVSNFLSDAMDKLFAILQSFLTVQPIQADTNGPIFRGWAIMRNFANVAFIIAFLIIIYSQVTSIGISSYGIKRLLPRIIVAAILVNLSYWICAIAVDLSNIFGHSIYDVMEGIRKELVGSGTTAGPTSWRALTGAILAGGAAGGAIATGVVVTLASAGGSIMLLLPILLGVVLAVLVAIMVLAARQAIIVVAIMIAPLAFVAYLLPNTEKFFNKWRELLTTLLLMFPLFAGVMGGAQLAGEAIIQTAIHMGDDVAKLNLIIFGMAVKVAPVVVTPFLLKFSGSLVGRVAGIVNNPGKGLVDRTRNWSKDRADAYTAKQLANKDNPNFLARQAQRMDTNKRKREGWKKAYQDRADANWHNEQAYRDIHTNAAQTESIKQAAENHANQHVAEMRATDATMQGLDINARASKLALDVSQAKVDANWEEIKAGDSGNMVVPSSLAVNALASYQAGQRAQAQSILEDSIQNTAEVRRASVAKEAQQNTYAQAMIDRAALQQQAGGIAGDVGADSALADAIKQKRSMYADEVKAAGELIKHFNLDGTARQTLAMGKADVEVKNAAGEVIKTFKSDSKYMREAAIEAQLSGKGNYLNMEEIITASGSNLKDYATTISDAIVSYKIADKAPFMGGKTINTVSQGGIGNEDQLATAIAKSIAGGKIKAEHLVSMDQDALKSMVAKVGGKSGASLGLDAAESVKFEYFVHQLGNDAQKARTDPRLNSRLAVGAVEALEKLENLYPPGSPPPPAPPPSP